MCGQEDENNEEEPDFYAEPLEPPVNVPADTTEERPPAPATPVPKRVRERLHREAIDSVVTYATPDLRETVETAFDSLDAFSDRKINKVTRALRKTLTAELRKEVKAPR